MRRESLQRVIELIPDNGEITSAQLAQLLGVTRSHARRLLRELIELGRLDARLDGHGGLAYRHPHTG